MVSSLKKEKTARSTKEKTPGPPPDQLYAPDSVAGLCSTLIKENFTILQHLTASCALLHHGTHIDGTDSQTQTPGGPHPLYFGFQEETETSTRLSLAHEDFKEVCTRDLFNAVCLISILFILILMLFSSFQVVQQDHLDGGISVLLCCLGFTAQQNLRPEDIVADVYITPCVFQDAPQKMSKSVALLVQGFCQEMALPHLYRFTKSCNVEGIGPIPSPGTFYFLAITLC